MSTTLVHVHSPSPGEIRVNDNTATTLTAPYVTLEVGLVGFYISDLEAVDALVEAITTARTLLAMAAERQAASA